jgi:pyruvate,water dikinase
MGNKMAKGHAVGEKLAARPLFLIRNERELRAFGELMVAPATSLDWEPVMKLAAAIVTDHDGRTCHAFITRDAARVRDGLGIDSISIISLYYGLYYGPCAPIRDAEHDRAEAKAIAS